MLTTAIAKATSPNLGWTGSEPGLLTILAAALRKPAGKTARKPDGSSPTRRFAKPQPVPFAWL